MKNYFKRMSPAGSCPPRKPIHKIIWSWIGAFLGIILVSVIGKYFSSIGTQGLFLVGSFGASAVLVYGAPLAEFSQPRNLVGGHFFSAIVGVTIFMFFWRTEYFCCSIGGFASHSGDALYSNFASPQAEQRH